MTNCLIRLQHFVRIGQLLAGRYIRNAWLMAFSQHTGLDSTAIGIISKPLVAHWYKHSIDVAVAASDAAAQNLHHKEAPLLCALFLNMKKNNIDKITVISN